MSDKNDTDCDRIIKMWRDLADAINAWVPIALEGGAVEDAGKAMVLAAMAEACYWQADGQFTEQFKAVQFIKIGTDE